MNTSTHRHGVRRSAFALVAVGALALAACGSDDDGATTTDAPAASSASTVAPDSTDAPASTDAPDATNAPDSTNAPDGTDGEGATVDLDTNGDGEIVFGVATPGPRDDGAYYQALVEKVESFSKDNGYADPIIVDNIDPAQAETEIRNLARQNVDVITIGASELADPLESLATEFPDIFWYCNCGASQQIPGIAQSSDDSAQISYSAGYATGLLLQDTDSTSAAFLGCCDLDFEKEAFLGFQLGLQAVDSDFTVTYIPTGDFDDVAGATEAFNQAVAAGAGAVYPYLGGALESVVGLANEQDIIVMSAGSSSVCEDTDLDYQIAVQFDAGDYLGVIFQKIADGELKEGETFVFTVGEYPFVGAKFCDATPEQVDALNAVEQQLADGDFTDQLLEVKKQAYGF